METPAQTIKEVWAEFDAMRSRLRNNTHQQNINSDQNPRIARA